MSATDIWQAPAGLWTGARRLPYFYTLPSAIGDNTVVCPQCAMEYQGDERLSAQYTVVRSVMCVRCGILMGPINESEASDE